MGPFPRLRSYELTPQRFITELLKYRLHKCCSCGGPATRYATGMLLIGDPFNFCDRHTIADIKGWDKIVIGQYAELDDAEFIRHVLKWLDENRIEELT